MKGKVENDRLKVIEFAVKMEYLISGYLGFKLNINPEESKSLGNSSSSLSFNAKMNLLLDLQLLNKEDSKKLILFSEIRNQFAHNISADSIENCLATIDNGEKRLRQNTYPKKIVDTLKIEAVFDKFLLEISRISSKLFNSTVDDWLVDSEMNEFITLLTDVRDDNIDKSQ